ncbi:MAG: DUF2279 domain-containing protein [Chitinophagaceae bacterium]|nr:DUF2279 domain-containing protein [Chitinophagaceae bacterium]
MNLRTLWAILLFSSINLCGLAQNHVFMPADSIHRPRLIGVCAGQAGIWVGSMIALNQAWYANYPRSKFHLFNDTGEWNQVDKVGHAWSAYWGAQFSSGLFRWAGVPRKRAALYGAGMGIAYESVIEILDGFSAEWGFSLADMAANTGGSLLYAGQEYAWGEQRIQFKFSSHRINYQDAELRQKANQLYGASLPERILKDYNGQTYWLSVNMASFAKTSRIPKWLNIAVGYGSTGLFGGYTNDWTDANGVYHDRRDIARIRQFYLSPDIDLSKITIKGRKPKIFQLLNGIKLKFPMPALEWNTGGQWRMHGIYF